MLDCLDQLNSTTLTTLVVEYLKEVHEININNVQYLKQQREGTSHPYHIQITYNGRISFKFWQIILEVRRDHIVGWTMDLGLGPDV